MYKMDEDDKSLAHNPAGISPKKDAKKALKEVSGNLKKASKMHGKQSKALAKASKSHAKDSKRAAKIAKNMKGTGNPHYEAKGSY